MNWFSIAANYAQCSCCVLGISDSFCARSHRSQVARVFVRVLFVEDVETDAELAVRRMLRDGLQCAYTRVETEAAFSAALRERAYDIILSDFSLPQFDGMSALALASREVPE